MTEAQEIEHGKRLYYQRKFAESEKIFRRLAESVKHRDQGLYGLGLIQFQTGSLDSAERKFRECLEANPKHSDALFYLGQISFRRGATRKAVSFYDQALEKNPNHAAARRQIDNLMLRTLIHAKQLYWQQRLDEGERAFGDLVDSRRYKAAGLYGIGVIKYQQRSLELAKEKFEQCVKVHPRHANAYFYLGRVWKELKEPERAEFCYRKALEINPSHAGALSELGSSLAPPVSGEASQSRLAAQEPPAVAQMVQSLQMSGRPALSAYLGPILVRVLGGALLILLVNIFEESRVYIDQVLETLDLLLLLILISYLVIYVLAIRHSLVRIDNGRLAVERGLVHSTLQEFDLRSIQKLELRRSLLNRLTDDGTLILHMARPGNQTSSPARPDVVKLTRHSKGPATVKSFPTTANPDIHAARRPIGIMGEEATTMGGSFVTRTPTHLSLRISAP